MKLSISRGFALLGMLLFGICVPVYAAAPDNPCLSMQIGAAMPTVGHAVLACTRNANNWRMPSVTVTRGGDTIPKQQYASVRAGDQVHIPGVLIKTKQLAVAPGETSAQLCARIAGAPGCVGSILAINQIKGMAKDETLQRAVLFVPTEFVGEQVAVAKVQPKPAVPPPSPIRVKPVLVETVVQSAPVAVSAPIVATAPVVVKPVVAKTVAIAPVAVTAAAREPDILEISKTPRDPIVYFGAAFALVFLVIGVKASGELRGRLSGPSHRMARLSAEGEAGELVADQIKKLLASTRVLPEQSTIHPVAVQHQQDDLAEQRRRRGSREPTGVPMPTPRQQAAGS